MPCEHLEDTQVVLVELVEAELRDDDHADRPRAEPKRDGEKRLLDDGGARDALAVLVVGGVADEKWPARLGHMARDAATDLRPEELDSGHVAVDRGQISA